MPTEDPYSGPEGPERWIRIKREERFPKVWTKALSAWETVDESYDELWQHQEAVAELWEKKSKLLWTFPEAGRPSSLPDLGPVLLHQVDVYRRYVNKVVTTTRTLNEVLNSVSGCERSVSGQLFNSRLDYELGWPVDKIRNLLADIRGKKAAFWRNIFLPPERPKQDDVEVVWEEPSSTPIFDYRVAFKDVLYPDPPLQERQLDSKRPAQTVWTSA